MSVPLLESYTCGRWLAPSDEGVALPDAVTGEIVARVSSSTVDIAGMIDHARNVGGPALRTLNYQERSTVLKQLALALMADTAEFCALSRRTGATDRDTAVDVDGGFGTLLAYASRGRKELPAGTVLLDGPAERLGKSGTFVGQHVLTPLRGVAVQINAFNFPVWGFLEKLAPAFLAGVPTIVKPASPTAYLTAAVVRRIIDSGLLPEGSLQLLVGSPEGILDHLGGQDLVAFTGSATTAAKLRSHPAVTTRAVRFNAEADSLNCSVLGPDAAPGTPEFSLYVDQLVTEMTVKAGQRCTAIRRALVPAAFVSDVVDATRERMRTVVVGNPANPDVTMGALANLAQREEVRHAVSTLTRSAKPVVGDPHTVNPVDADADRGAFLAPILLRGDDPDAAEPHDVEAFGPVSTVLPYTDVAHAAALAVRGHGSLVGSLVTYDSAVAGEFLVATAHSHGRILILDRDSAAENTGHGTPMPMLVHGGPGRAGGGEELGGLRAVHHHLQRTAIQASPAVLTALGLGEA